jgi:UPF0755 protein
VFSLGLVVAFFLVGVAAATWWVYRQIDPPGPPGEVVSIVVPEGADGSALADILEDNGIIADARIFRQYIRLRGRETAGRFQAGTYEFARNSSIAEALGALEKGPAAVPALRVTIPEGLRVPDMLDLIADAVPWFDRAVLQELTDSLAVPSGLRPEALGTYEGVLFPDTYEVQEGTTEAQFLETLARQAERVAAEVGLEAKAARLGVSPYQAIVIASLIERETRIAEERPRVARVIYNRIAQDMRLDIDATVLYALGRTSGEITASDLEVDSPYNTRRYKGIPPTPIAAPGRASLEAALDPEPGNWLFYVLEDAEGRHYFTEDFADFNRAVARAAEAGLL